MKLILTLVLTLFIQLKAFASDTAIKFSTVGISEVFKLAKKEKKGVMIFFHFDGCGACVKMQKSAFIDKNVAGFYNKNFVCIDVNTMKGSGIETNKIYKIKIHPTFLFLDENGNILNKIVGIFSSEEFIAHGQNALNPLNTLSSLKQKYNNGNHDSDFLFYICHRLRNANELDSFMINEYFKTQSNDLKKEKNIRFIYESVIYNSKICIPFDSREYFFMDSQKEYFKPFFDIEQVNTRIMFIILDATYKAVEMMDSVFFNHCLTALEKYDIGQVYYYKETDGRLTRWTTSSFLVLSARLAYYEKLNNLEKYDEVLKLYLEKIWNNSEVLNSLACDHYQKYEERRKLENAINYILRSIKVNSNYANSDTYACLLYKLSDYDKALLQAENSIE